MFHILYLLSALIPAPVKVTCQCIPIYDSVGNEIKINYDLIFKGKVEKIDTVFYVTEGLLRANYSTRDSGSYVTGLMVLLNVNNIFKGSKTTQKIRIITGIGGGDCGYYFQAGKSYIVYAQKRPYILIDSFNDENKISFKSHDEVLFETDVCSGTTDQVMKKEAVLKKG
jgi:hypothetical protein